MAVRAESAMHVLGDTRRLDQQFIPEKFTADLAQGFSIKNPDSVMTYAILKNGADFFCVTKFQPDNLSFPYNSVEIRRRKNIGAGKGTATLERFVLKNIDSSHAVPMYYINQNKGGRLPEQDFFTRYNTAEFHAEATSLLQALLTQPPEKV